MGNAYPGTFSMSVSSAGSRLSHSRQTNYGSPPCVPCGSPLAFPTICPTHALPKSTWWPTIPRWRGEPGGSEFRREVNGTG